MNNIKKIALSLLVVGLAIGFSAFKNAEHKNNANILVPVWYTYIGEAPADGSTALVESNYELYTGEGEPCPGTSDFCGVKAEPNGSLPDLSPSTDARTEITNFFNSVSFDTDIISQEL